MFLGVVSRGENSRCHEDDVALMSASGTLGSDWLRGSRFCELRDICLVAIVL